MWKRIRKIDWIYGTVKAVVYGFMLGAAGISFSHIVKVGFDWGLTWEAWTAPFFIDGLAVLGIIGRHPRWDKEARDGAWWLIVPMGILSLACNVMAGNTIGQKVYGGLLVAGFGIAEWYASKLRPNRPAAEERPTQPRRQKTEEERLEDRRKRAKYYEMTPQQKADWTREDTKRQNKRKDSSVPISPAGPTKEMVPSVQQLDEIAA